jgi:hypothetical protein
LTLLTKDEFGAARYLQQMKMSFIRVPGGGQKGLPKLISKSPTSTFQWSGSYLVTGLLTGKHEDEVAHIIAPHVC